MKFIRTFAAALCLCLALGCSSRTVRMVTPGGTTLEYRVTGDTSITDFTGTMNPDGSFTVSWGKANQDNDAAIGLLLRLAEIAKAQAPPLVR